MKRRGFIGQGLIVTVGLALAAACAPLPPPAPPLPPAPPDRTTAPPDSPDISNTNTSFVTQTLTSTGLVSIDRPWDLAFVPGTNLGLFTERGGRISSFDHTVGGPAVLVGDVPNVLVYGEAGLMGIAVDPDFATNHFIYICVSSATSDWNELRRYTVDLAAVPGAGLDLTSEVVMLAISPVNPLFFHNGCRIRFQPGTSPPALFITVGDGGVPTGPQSLTSSTGKVLRVRIDSGAVVAYPGNPHIGAARVRTQLLFTLGHRNPQGLAFRPGDNTPFTSEHGPSVNDEVNRLVAGGNGGWDPNDPNQPGKYVQEVPMTDLAKFPNAMIPAWRSGDVSTKAPSGMTFLSDPKWKSWDGALAVAFLKDRRLRIMFLTSDGAVTESWPVLALGTRLRSVAQGPDANLYLTTDAGAPGDAIWKVEPAP